MATEVTFENKEVLDFLKNIDKKLKNIKDGERNYISLLSAIVYRDINEHFEKEEGSGGKWEHWSFWYALQMEKKGKGGNKILQDTGRLRNSFKPMSMRKTGEGFLWFNNAQTKKGFPYAYAHDEGGDKLPKRDFMWLSEDAQEKISVQTLQFMIEMGV